MINFSIVYKLLIVSFSVYINVSVYSIILFIYSIIYLYLYPNKDIFTGLLKQHNVFLLLFYYKVCLLFL